MDYRGLRAGSVVHALMFKERKRFLGSPVYLTNMGLGLVMILALAVAGAIFREQVLEFLALIPGMSLLTPLIICAFLGFLVSTACISTPSVSLEGKCIWILKSLPLSSRADSPGQAPVPQHASGARGHGLRLDFWGCCVASLAWSAASRWARLDWLTEAHPCKQSVALVVTMLGQTALLLAGGLLYGLLLRTIVTPTEFLALFTLLTALLCLVLYRALVTWGVGKWEAL